MGIGRLRMLMIGLSGGLCLLILAPAFLAAHSCFTPAAFAYIFFSPVCHQIPERSFYLWGHPLAVCQRCSGIYFGLLLALLLPLDKCLRFCSPLRRRICVLCMSAPIMLDALLPYLGIWSSTYISRFVTGLFFGSLSAVLLSRALSEFVAEARGKQNITHCMEDRGIIS
jgi:uncharacterized membrane protein